MPYDEAMADRIRNVVGPRPDVAEIKMFGALCFTTGGNMFASITRDDLMVRVEKSNYEAALARPGAHLMEMGRSGRTMVGMLFVGKEGTADEASFASWVREAYDYAASLPVKPPKAKKPPRAKKTA